MSQTVQNFPEFGSVIKCKEMDYKKMDTEALNRMVLDRIQQLEQQGLVDHHFRQCYSLKEDSGPLFFVELIPIFFSDACLVIKEMGKTLDKPAVNFGEMYSHCIKLKGSSSCIGACRIRDACSNLRNAIDNNSKDGCLQALNLIKHEHKCLDDELDSLVKMEREIVSRAI